MPRHLAPVADLHTIPAEAFALGTARLLLDIARADLDATAATLEAAQAAYLTGGAA
jgi:hypothetical protein